ncbi:type III pantothenate kinase [bacterium]|nr:type III pantothenate kinase [bacterium]
MILTLDVGNSQIYGGIFKDETLVQQFRKSSKQGCSSDEIGLFLKQIVQEHGYSTSDITEIALCSVVPDLIHSVGSACLKYFQKQPFLLRAGTKTGLKIRYRNPLEVGADRIANAIAATTLFPRQNLIIVDFGTATTFCAITAQKDYLGGIIMPGLRLAMEALESKTAQLPAVQIRRTSIAIGRSTTESIQSGLYLGTLYQVKGLLEQIKAEGFNGEKCLVIGTGGFSRLFEDENLFDQIIPELVHLGLRDALSINHKFQEKEGERHATKHAEI